MTALLDLPVQLVFPDGFPVSRLGPFLDPLAGERSERGARHRREMTRNDPLLFALTYCREQIIVRCDDGDDDVGEYGLVSFSEYHLDLIWWARSWMFTRPRRDAWVAPRASGKSTWPCLILPVWALAHGHRRFVLMLSNNDGAVKKHESRIHAQLEDNERLLVDFPDLAVSKDGRDRVTRAGQMVMARSIKSQIQGAVAPDGTRPDLIVLDDIEKDEANYSAEERDRRLATMRNNILPMNEHAIVALVGTTTMYGSIMHDVVMAARGERVAKWIRESQFAPHYYPAILDEGGPRERSLWPGSWSLSWLKRERDSNPSYFALNYANRPELGGGQYWTHDLFVQDESFMPRSLVMAVDTAASAREEADEFGIAIVGSDGHPIPERRRLCVVHAWKGHLTPEQLHAQIWCLKDEYPMLEDLVVEVIGTGGDKWASMLAPLPPNLCLTLGNPSRRGAKTTRLKWLLSEYQRRAIVHRYYFGDLCNQMLAWPQGKDDLMDAVEMGVAFHRDMPMN